MGNIAGVPEFHSPHRDANIKRIVSRAVEEFDRVTRQECDPVLPESKAQVCPDCDTQTRNGYSRSPNPPHCLRVHLLNLSPPTTALERVGDN